MRNETRLYPDVAIPPGEHLVDTLRELGMSQSELARRMERPVQAINEIARGAKAITAETAIQLEEVTGVPAHVWVRLEADYRLVRARIAFNEVKNDTGPGATPPSRRGTFTVARHARSGVFLLAAKKRKGAKVKTEVVRRPSRRT